MSKKENHSHCRECEGVIKKDREICYGRHPSRIFNVYYMISFMWEIK